MIQNSVIKCYHEFHERSHKDLQVLILAGPFQSLTKAILWWPYVRLKVKFWGGNKFVNAKNFFLRVMWVLSIGPKVSFHFVHGGQIP